MPINRMETPGNPVRFNGDVASGTSREGMPIGVQIVGNWYAESTILYAASLLEQVSSVRDERPSL